MEIPKNRTCGICGIKNIPYGVDWPWWRKGEPVHGLCATWSDIQKAKAQK